MIILQDNKLTIQNPLNNTFEGNFTIILQNTVTREVFQYNVANIHKNPLYYHFEIDVNLNDGEYFLLLVHNPSFADIDVMSDISNIQDKKMGFVAIANDDTVILNDGYYIGFGYEVDIKIVTRELLRIGEFENKTTQYDKNNKYVIYKG